MTTYTAITRFQLIDALHAAGFKHHTLASSKWRNGLWYTNKKGSLLVLVRARGVDVLVSPLKVHEMVNEKGDLKVMTQREGHLFGEYNYTDSGEDIHAKVLAVVDCFVHENPFEDDFFTKVGISRREWAKKYGAKTIEQEARLEMQEIYECISIGDGQPAYMGDGVWVTSDGELIDTEYYKEAVIKFQLPMA